VSLTEDPWLSGVLGRPVWALDGDRSGDAPGFYYAKVPVDDVGRVRRLTEQGFAVVDVNVTLARRSGPVGPGAGAVAVEPARSEHHAALVQIAGSCFAYSRFHLDPDIPDELANHVKREWLRSYVDGRRGVELLAAHENGAPVGFLAVLERDGARVIDLVGVARSAQRRGIGSALVAEFVARHGAPGRDLVVGTQVANVPSLRLYAAHDFAVSSSAYVLHRHVGNG
jgi:ribosomal protein S18 acetylase RimI-like enzyme